MVFKGNRHVSVDASKNSFFPYVHGCLVLWTNLSILRVHFGFYCINFCLEAIQRIWWQRLLRNLFNRYLCGLSKIFQNRSRRIKILLIVILQKLGIYIRNANKKYLLHFKCSMICEPMFNCIKLEIVKHRVFLLNMYVL